MPEAEQATILIQMGDSCQKEGNYPKAREVYERAIPLLSAEGQAQVLMTIALGFGQQDDVTAAIDTFQRAEEIDPDSECRTEVEEFLKFLEQGG